MKFMLKVRNDWTKEEIADIYHQPLLELIYQAAEIHRKFNDPLEVQINTLLSIKTGGCSEDCGYCSQSAKNEADSDVHALLDMDTVVEVAKKAKKSGSTRFCMGAAWREVRNNRDFDRVLEMVKAVKALGLEVCCTLGMITEEQAKKLAEAGVDAYNHNLDTSEEHYKEVISTRTYEDRLKTLENVRKADMGVCSGGILGLGESHEDRISMLHTLCTMEKHPESVPVNALVGIPGTPMENNPPVPVFDIVRMIATARILMPKANVRISAGRTEMSKTDQALCFMAGANSIFAGEKLLTTPNPDFSEDNELLEQLGLKPREANKAAKSNKTVEAEN